MPIVLAAVIAVAGFVFSACSFFVSDFTPGYTLELEFPVPRSWGEMSELSNFSGSFTHVFWWGREEPLSSVSPANVQVTNGILSLQLGTPRRPYLFHSPPDVLIFEITAFTNSNGDWLFWEDETGKPISLLWSNRAIHLRSLPPEDDEPGWSLDWNLNAGWNFLNIITNRMVTLQQIEDLGFQWMLGQAPVYE